LRGVGNDVLGALTGKQIIGSGSSRRSIHFHLVERCSLSLFYPRWTPGLKTNLKVIQGDLFLLERYIFLVSKQPTLVEISDIHFSLVGAGAG
jgi:hypothetical protein